MCSCGCELFVAAAQLRNETEPHGDVAGKSRPTHTLALGFWRRLVRQIVGRMKEHLAWR
jgi:hypothetical protein